MNKSTYMMFLRWIAAATAIGMWFLSVKFSTDGFNFVVPDMAWAGVMLALFVTAIELVWNKEGANGNLTLMAVGVAAYIYGIYTNVTGIMAAQGITDVMSDPVKILFPLILGVFLEITPEPLLVWGLIGTSFGGDFLSNLFNSAQSATASHQKPKQPSQTNRSVSQAGYRHKSIETHDPRYD
jgi:hypothetical protein